MFTATAHSRPLILLLRGTALTKSAVLADCSSGVPLETITEAPLQLPVRDSLYPHTNGDLYLYLRTDTGKRLCVSGLQTLV